MKWALTQIPKQTNQKLVLGDVEDEVEWSTTNCIVSRSFKQLRTDAIVSKGNADDSKRYLASRNACLSEDWRVRICIQHVNINLRRSLFLDPENDNGINEWIGNRRYSVIFLRVFDCQEYFLERTLHYHIDHNSHPNMDFASGNTWILIYEYYQKPVLHF